MRLSKVERAALDVLLAVDHPCAARLQRQLDSITEVDREWTSVGFFAHFTGVAEGLRLQGPARACFELPPGQVPGVPGVVSLVLFVDEGLIRFLEGHLTRFDWSEVRGPDWPAELHEALVLAETDEEAIERLRQSHLETLRQFR